MISECISDDIPPQIKILNTAIPIPIMIETCDISATHSCINVITLHCFALADKWFYAANSCWL